MPGFLVYADPGPRFVEDPNPGFFINADLDPILCGMRIRILAFAGCRSHCGLFVECGSAPGGSNISSFKQIPSKIGTVLLPSKPT